MANPGLDGADLRTFQPPDLPRDAVYTSCYCEENIYLLCQRFSSIPAVADNWLISAVFISNKAKKVALFFQKAARSARLPVVWDYHVILLLQPKDLNLARVVREPGIGESLEGDPAAQNRAGSYVYDLDSHLPSPCPWEDYLELTFPSSLLPEYQSSFRVISAQTYLDSFVSDRSHMLVKNARELEDGQVELDDENMPHDEKPDIGSKVAFSTLSYSAEPPSYEPLCGALMAGSGIGSNLMSHFVCMEATPGVFGEVLERQEIRSRF